MSSNADRFHEKFRLTELVAQANAGILTRHGDMLVCFALVLKVAVRLENKGHEAAFASAFLRFVSALSLPLCHKRTKGTEPFNNECPLSHDNFKTVYFLYTFVTCHICHPLLSSAQALTHTV